MIIYKFTNKINGKVYIGKTEKTLEWRINKHVYDMEHYDGDKNYFHRALKKYGIDNFNCEIIDSCDDKKLLSEKEIYWISFYDSTNKEKGYNGTKGGDGGETFINLSEAEMREISKKISEKISGKNNGMSKQIKCKSVITNEELHFDTVQECLNHFNVKNKSFISIRISKECNTLWKNEWMFAYEDQDYITCNSFDPSTRKGKRIILEKDGIKLEFPSKNKAIEYLGTTKGSFNSFIEKEKYIIKYL